MILHTIGIKSRNNLLTEDVDQPIEIGDWTNDGFLIE